MIRTVAISVVLLLLGAVATVAAAWAGALWGSTQKLPTEPDAQWVAAVRPAIDVNLNSTSAAEAWSICATLRTDYAQDVLDVVGDPWAMFTVERHRLRAGLPLRALQWRFEQQYGTLPYAPQDSYLTGLSIPGSNDYFSDNLWRRLPLEPLPLAFAADSIFWALIFFAGLRLASLGIRRWRRRSSRCVRCGYTLVDTQLCPECGIHQPQMRPSTV